MDQPLVQRRQALRWRGGSAMDCPRRARQEHTRRHGALPKCDSVSRAIRHQLVLHYGSQLSLRWLQPFGPSSVSTASKPATAVSTAEPPAATSWTSSTNVTTTPRNETDRNC